MENSSSSEDTFFPNLEQLAVSFTTKATFFTFAVGSVGNKGKGSLTFSDVLFFWPPFYESTLFFFLPKWLNPSHFTGERKKKASPEFLPHFQIKKRASKWRFAIVPSLLPRPPRLPLFPSLQCEGLHSFNGEEEEEEEERGKSCFLVLRPTVLFLSWSRLVASPSLFPSFFFFFPPFCH